jgi:tetratricopeptide (TPR) repeat protein
MKWFNEGNDFFRDGKYDRAIKSWEKALQIGKEEKIDEVIVNSLMNIGTAYNIKKEWDKAVQYFHQCLELERKKGNTAQIAECLMKIADALFSLKKWDNARDYYTQYLEIYKEKDRNKARVLLNMGLSLFSEGDWKKAKEYYKQSLDVFKKIDDVDGISTVLANLGIIARNLGNWEEAIDYYHQSFEMDEKRGDKQGSATCLMNIGIALEALGKVKDAVENYQKSLAIFKELKDDKRMATCLLNIGNAFGILEKWDKAVKFYKQSRKMFEKLKDKSNVSKCLTNIGIALRNLGHWQDAIKQFKESLEWFESLNDQAAISKCLFNLGVSYYTIDNWSEALNYYEQSLELFRKLGDRPGEALICYNLGVGYHKNNEIREALKYFTESLGIYNTLLTQISSEEYRESYAREFADLPNLIIRLSVILEEQSDEIMVGITTTSETEGKEAPMNKLLTQLKDNITQLNVSVKGQVAMSQFTENISALMNLVDKTLVTFTTTEKMKSEILSQRIMTLIETCSSFIEFYQSCKLKVIISTLLRSLDKIYSKLVKSFPELDLNKAMISRIEQVKEEYNEKDGVTESLSLELKFSTLSWIKPLINMTKSNINLYKETGGEQDQKIIQDFELKLENLSKIFTEKEQEYSDQVLNYLLVIKIDSGIALYQENFIEMEFDSTLMGGFLSAISSFGAEFTRERTRMEKLAYKDFKIHFQDGKYIRCALILKGKITELLKNRLKLFVTDFENTYQENLSSRAGNVSVFSNSGPLVRKYFDFGRDS